MFLLDGSDDTRSDFTAMKTFVQRVVAALNVGEDNDRVSVVQYSRDPQAHFSLNTYTEKQDVLAAVQQLNHKGGRPRNTGAALNYVRKTAFADSSGSRHREGVPQILILLSGGRSEDDVASAAVALKQGNVVPFCVGTRNADIIEQQMIAHNPSYAFSVRQFDDIGSIDEQLVSFVKGVPRQQPRLTTRIGIGKTLSSLSLSVSLSKWLSYYFHYTLSSITLESLFLTKILQIQPNPFSVILYLYWIPRMKCKVISQQWLALFKDWWRNSMWRRIKTVCLWCSTADSLPLNFC